MEMYKYGKEIEQLKGQRNALLDLKVETQQAFEDAKAMEVVYEQAHAIVQMVARDTQNELRAKLEPIVSLALESVFGEDAYEFEIEFVERRGKTEADIYFLDNGRRIKPLLASGFGAADVATFALRLAVWHISRPKTQGVFILDEPLKHLSENLQEKAMEMMKMLSERLGIQILLVTHTKESDVIEFSDKVFKVTKTGDKSQVKVIKDASN